MTKVWLPPDLLEYRRAMAEALEQLCRKTRLAGLGQQGRQAPARLQNDLPIADLLAPPRIERIYTDLWISRQNGRLEGLIQIHTFRHDPGIMNVYVTLEDEWGQYIEGDFAIENEFDASHWGYLPFTERLPRGMCITVYALAMDQLGAVGALRARAVIE